MKTLQALGLTVLAFLAPTKSIIFTVAGLTMVDLALGILASRKAGVKVNSRGLKHSIVKVLVYEVAVVLAFVVEHNLTGASVPLLNMLSTLIGLTELKSCLENLDIIYGEPFFRAIISKISYKADGDSNPSDPKESPTK